MIVTDAGWNAVDRQRFAREGVAGRVERLVSDQQRADERCCSVRRSRVVLTPDAGVKFAEFKSAQPGLDKTYPQATVANKPDHRGEHEGNRLKPLRAGTSGDSGVLVVTRVRSTNTKCTRDRGCNGHPAFPTPSMGGKFINGSGAWRGEVAHSRLDVHCEPTGRANARPLTGSAIAVGTLIAERPPHRTVRAAFPHTAPTLGGVTAKRILGHG